MDMTARETDETDGTAVTRWLDAAGVAYRAHRHVPVLNAREALDRGLGFDPESLLKTLVFGAPGGYLLVAMRAPSRLAYGALARAVGVGRDRLSMLDADTLREVFGWEPGGAAPIPLVPGAGVWVDASVPMLPRVWFGGGRPDLTLQADSAELWAAVPHRTASLAA